MSSCFAVDAPMSVAQHARRDLIRTVGLLACAAAGVLPRRSVAAGSPESPTVASRWTPEAVERLTSLQKRAYQRLGQQLGLGNDPDAVYARLTSGQVPADKISQKAFEQTFGAAVASSIGSANLAEPFDRSVRFHSARPPTPYEEPVWYSTLLEMADAIESAARARNIAVPRNVLFGSMPSGNVDARSILLPDGKGYIVVFENGLFRFCHQMAALMAAALPPLRPLVPGPRAALTPERRQEITTQFNRVLLAYAVKGDPRVQRLPLNPPEIATAAALLRGMELFVLGHEYGHAMMRHNERAAKFRDSEESWLRWSHQAEFEADEIGFSLAFGVMGGLPLEYTVAGADLSLASAEVVQQCVALLSGVPPGRAVGSDHPSAQSRRERLHSVLREIRPGQETEHAIAASEQVLALVALLWQHGQPQWIALRDKGVRPFVAWS